MKNLKSILVLSTLLLMFITSCSKEEKLGPKTTPKVVLTIEDDRNALIEIFKANSNTTLKWDITSTDVSKWEGITVEDNRVTIIGIANRNIETLPVEAMRKLTKLKVLAANGNGLTSIDVTNNVNLERLVVNSNKLTAIDVSKNISLIKLLFDINELKELDVSMLSKLTSLSARQNKFTSSVNVANGNNVNMRLMLLSSPTLKCVQVDNIDAVIKKGGWSINTGASYSLGCN